MASNQELTHRWWNESSSNFDLFISEFVVQEASAGDPIAAKRRLEVISDLPKLEITIQAETLAICLLKQAALPTKARLDALHIAVATLHGIDYLLTWNCRHIANAVLRPRIESVCRNTGYEPPTICTPQELVES